MRIGVFGSRCKAEQLCVIKDLFGKLNVLKADVFIQSFFYDYLREQFNYTPDIMGDIDESDMNLDLALSVGGDGSFLRTVSQLYRHHIPILGINTGNLGFLADVGSNQIDETLDEFFRGDYLIEERSLLQLLSDDQPVKGMNHALNEIAILKRDTATMITIHTYLNGDYLTSYQANGLLVATPTGSTAYSMSVNGPILLPQNRSFILSPVAPHSLNVRPVVIPDDYTITLKVESRTNSFLVSLDGRAEEMPGGIVLKIKMAACKTRLVKRLNQSFYRTLREKLMWGGGAKRDMEEMHL